MRTMKAAGALALTLTLVGCGDGERVGGARAAIIGGTATDGDPAVVLLVSYPPDHLGFATCTATLVAPTVLLTAAHCVDEATHPDDTFGVFAGPDASAFTTVNTLIPQLLAVAETHAHPDYDPSAPFYADIGVVILAAPLDETPLSFHREPLTESIVGTEARIVGYGETTYGELNTTKHEAITVIAELGDTDTIRVGDAEHRSCIGDSGGPAFVEVEGTERIVGVDSYSALKGCLEPASYRRPDVFTDFLDTYVPPPTPPDDDGDGGSAPCTTCGAPDDAPPTEAGDGCAVRSGPGGSSPSLAALAALAVALRRRRITRASGPALRR